MKARETGASKTKEWPDTVQPIRDGVKSIYKAKVNAELLFEQHEQTTIVLIN